MAPVIDYYYSVMSTWSYIGSHAFAELAAKHGATVNHRPMNLLKVFEVSGGLPLGKRPLQRQKYRKIEMKRWKAFRKIPMTLDPAFWPVDPEMADRMIIAVQEEGFDPMPLANALMRAVWVEDRNVSDEETLIVIADEQDLDGSLLLDLAKGEHTEQIYARYTEEAIERDVFGAPFFIFEGEPYWGQDRLELLDLHLSRAAG